jgi:hypothetical protein
MKQSGLNYSFSTLSNWVDQNVTSNSMETIKESSRAGAMATAETLQSTLSSDASLPTSLSNQLHTLSIQHLSPVNPTLQMVHPEESAAAWNSFSHSYQSTPTLLDSSLIRSLSPPTLPYTIPIAQFKILPASSRTILSTIPEASIQTTASSPTISTPSALDSGKINPHFNTSLPVHPHSTKPQPYKLGLLPLPSPLHPHCIARERLRQWFPLQSRSARDAKGPSYR